MRFKSCWVVESWVSCEGLTPWVWWLSISSMISRMTLSWTEVLIHQPSEEMHITHWPRAEGELRAFNHRNIRIKKSNGKGPRTLTEGLTPTSTEQFHWSKSYNQGYSWGLCWSNASSTPPFVI
jgi:hypothetical protein